MLLGREEGSNQQLILLDETFVNVPKLQVPGVGAGEQTMLPGRRVRPNLTESTALWAWNLLDLILGRSFICLLTSILYHNEFRSAAGCSND